MVKSISERILSFSRFIFFDIISDKFNAAPFKNFMDYLYVIFEKIAYSFKILSENYLMLYDELIKKEIVMAQITKKTNVLVIGCGSLPVTPILIALKTDADIIGIDYDKKAVDRAINFINKN